MRSRVLGATALALTTLVIAPQAAYGHGYTQAPPSRSYRCATGAVTGCGDIQYEPQSVEGPKGFPSAGPADGTLCSAGHDNFAPLDDPRGGAWPAESVTAGADFHFVWTLTASHATTTFRYFLTRDGWNPAAPLTRDQLEPTPFVTVDLGGARPPSTVEHDGTLPAGRSGRHLILGVWDIADTGNAFYSCADVDFG